MDAEWTHSSPEVHRAKRRSRVQSACQRCRRQKLKVYFILDPGRPFTDSVYSVTRSGRVLCAYGPKFLAYRSSGNGLYNPAVEQPEDELISHADGGNLDRDFHLATILDPCNMTRLVLLVPCPLSASHLDCSPARLWVMRITR